MLINAIKNKRAAILVVITTFSILCFFYSPVLFQANKVLYNDSGDAIKSYFAFAWHIRSDTSAVDFSGTNYPYGEHNNYVDAFIPLGNLVKYTGFLKPYAIGLYNLGPLLSYVLCAMLLYRILRMFHVNEWYSAIAAVGITFLCPQVFRMSEHYTLAYTFSIPLTIYLLLLQEKHPDRWWFMLAGGVANLVYFFFHPYLGLINCSFMFFFFASKLFFRPWGSRLPLAIAVQAIAPVVFFYLYLKLTDTHPDRIARPYGFSFYRSDIESVFISTHKPFRHFLSQIYPIKQQNYEGLAYVGITTLFCCGYLLFLLLTRQARLKTRLSQSTNFTVFFQMMVAAFVLLLFSMGYPLRWGPDSWLDHFKMLQQFRSPGRFAWVFYFVATIGTSVIVSRYFLAHKNKILRTGLRSALLLLLFVEGVPFHAELSKHRFPANAFQKEALDGELKQIADKVSHINAQAIIPLPYFHIGTDYYHVAGSDKIIRSALLLSYHINTPLATGCNPRNSLTEAESLIQLISNPLIKKPLRARVSTEKPFLILASKESLSGEELKLLTRGKMLVETNSYVVKEIGFNDLFRYEAPAHYSYFQKNRHLMTSKNGFFVAQPTSVYFCDFDSLPSKRFTGNGKGMNLVYTIPSASFQKDTTYELSLWYNTRDRLDLDNIFTVKEVLKNGDTLVLAEKNIKSMTDLQDGKILAVLFFKVTSSESVIFVNLKGISDREKIFYCDDLLIRPRLVDVYRLRYSPERKDSLLFLNNIVISPE